jgi:enediyne biosynthesis protein E4
LPIFVDITGQSGLFTITFPLPGSETGWLDYDNDGRQDLFIANGAVMLREEQRGQAAPFKERKFVNSQYGWRKIPAQAGKPFQVAEVTRGAAFGDIDNDGDVDIVITNKNGPARLLLNDGSPTPGWVEFRLVGNGSVNRDALGARITVFREGTEPSRPGENRLQLLLRK